MEILVTTLGKARKDDGGRYNTLNYRFEDGFEFASSFFMQALLEYRKHIQRKPDLVLVLGTASSMWDALLEQTNLDDLDLVETLLQENKAGAVSTTTLERLSSTLSDPFGVKIKCVLIPAGRNNLEQAEILRVIAEQVPEKATVCFDVTHGYRTLPLLELLSIFYLIQTRNATINEIFYGAADMRNDENPPVAPVIRLDFVKDMLEWLTRLPLAEETGRYDQLAAMFAQERPELAEALKQHSVQLRTNQTVSAHKSAVKIVALLDKPFDDPSAELYRPILQRKFNWSRGVDLAEWQILSAKAAVRAGDLLRATILLREARISLALPPDKQTKSKEREQANKNLNKETDADDELLLALRNCLAHADRPKNKQIRDLLQDEQALAKKLNRIADKLYQQRKDS
ncbi:MAG: TIGR02221 family CRISPR-associated protein [Oligosphaeraceae bacterium]|nr:TIGR02221 family CRISPR-associated protein [Oligosphaeraceae bacterium]